MAKVTIADEIATMIQAGATLAADNKFTDTEGNALRVRSMESMNDPLEVGDEITIPEDYKVLLVDVAGTPRPCTIVDVKSTDGSERHMQFFPNSLAKSVNPLDESDRRMPKVKTTGTVATWYASQTDVNEAMQYLKGKTIVVKDKATYRAVRNFTTKEIGNTSILQYDFK